MITTRQSRGPPPGVYPESGQSDLQVRKTTWPVTRSVGSGGDKTGGRSDSDEASAQSRLEMMRAQAKVWW